ncbi:unnamed protein product [Didymodactylos carnosus]|uniref:B30.2/SPRY domain-containing protein n=1 Tax=Didymodactylos carnosus TaxID=1234261 RepID=A0A814LJT9_9BILA|nr:unnamed protein product [Didymodactylos carnosus]CAF1300041.1 unnamed protein product [Didymodactylos carnosus]CAF3833938.1 unnamed protein product [Didymodactylos carnosus]CAF4106070.1 unnamed protein product [Didymodactylos carnosus]
MNEINTWEKETIQKITVAAEQAREKVRQLLHKTEDTIKQQLVEISMELQEGKVEENYVESTLDRWKEQLNEYKQRLESSNVSVSVHSKQIDWTTIIKVNGNQSDNKSTVEKFHSVLGNVRLEDNGLVAVQSGSNWSEVRGTGLYSSGEHRISLKIDKTRLKQIMVGIISSTGALNVTSYSSKSSYGWYCYDTRAYLNGVSTSSYYDGDIQSNDELLLMINCDENKLSLVNKRTGKNYEIPIDIHQAPFPWQLRLNMYDTGDVVRILV